MSNFIKKINIQRKTFRLFFGKNFGGTIETIKKELKEKKVGFENIMTDFFLPSHEKQAFSENTEAVNEVNYFLSQKSEKSQDCLAGGDSLISFPLFFSKQFVCLSKNNVPKKFSFLSSSGSFSSEKIQEQFSKELEFCNKAAKKSGLFDFSCILKAILSSGFSFFICSAFNIFFLLFLIDFLFSETVTKGDDSMMIVMCSGVTRNEILISKYLTLFVNVLFVILFQFLAAVVFNVFLGISLDWFVVFLFFISFLTFIPVIYTLYNSVRAVLKVYNLS